MKTKFIAIFAVGVLFFGCLIATSLQAARGGQVISKDRLRVVTALRKAYTLHASDFGHFWAGDSASIQANPNEVYTAVRFSGVGTLHSYSPTISLPHGTRVKALRASAEFSQNCTHSDASGRAAWEGNPNHGEVLVSLIRTSINPPDGFEYGRTGADLLPSLQVVITPSSPEVYANDTDHAIRSEIASPPSGTEFDLTRYYYHVVVNVQKGADCELKLHPISILYE